MKREMTKAAMLDYVKEQLVILERILESYLSTKTDVQIEYAAGYRDAVKNLLKDIQEAWE